MPYRLHNACGLVLYITKVLNTCRESQALRVEPDQVVDVQFIEEPDRHHRKTGGNTMAVHKLAVRVEGYREARTLIIADRVGTFVHKIQAEGRDLPSSQIVAEVRLEEGRKHIEIRSGLRVRNKTNVPVDLRLDGLGPWPTTTLPTLAPQASVAVPINLTSCNLRMRPHSWGMFWSDQALSWQSTMQARPGRSMGFLMRCDPIGQGGSTSDSAFFCCASIVKDEAPTDHRDLPCHTVTLVPPITLCNLLPCSFSYDLVHTKIAGTLASGESVGLYEADLRVRALGGEGKKEVLR